MSSISEMVHIVDLFTRIGETEIPKDPSDRPSGPAWIFSSASTADGATSVMDDQGVAGLR